MMRSLKGRTDKAGTLLSPDDIAALWPEARDAAVRATHVVHLPLRRHAWRGPAGTWLGVGLGNSLEFEDHRPYAPGDDLRHLDWPAYARTDQLVMKQHRHEAAPLVDVALDVSASQSATPAKARRTLELAAFAITCALESRAVVRLWAVGTDVEAWPLEAALGGRLPANLPARTPSAPTIDRVPWRRDALRVWVSDLLFPVPDRQAIAGLGGPRGHGLVMAPWARDEADPPWDGHMDIEDIETGARREQRVDRGLLARYRTAYTRHFDAWRDICRRHGVAFARIAVESDLTEALVSGGLPDGTLDWA